MRQRVREVGPHRARLGLAHGFGAAAHVLGAQRFGVARRNVVVGLRRPLRVGPHQAFAVGRDLHSPLGNQRHELEKIQSRKLLARLVQAEPASLQHQPSHSARGLCKPFLVVVGSNCVRSNCLVSHFLPLRPVSLESRQLALHLVKSRAKVLDLHVGVFVCVGGRVGEGERRFSHESAVPARAVAERKRMEVVDPAGLSASVSGEKSSRKRIGSLKSVSTSKVSASVVSESVSKSKISMTSRLMISKSMIPKVSKSMISVSVSKVSVSKMMAS
ncbi:hypothetical protein CLUG_03346 [Clavispora lusitaniae ATCC 42720]|uniref:Uncharacterized protein n=1 Tax=Clavispora lusitaniae (strain ATCC 42720) TaxID=306902 RepID=C4Y5B2_CLAL4|nr:uncharacterized protein CLUG_03346 [Clavispora lusitaniae ATCC 42720]EEQ39218.1 hypothetical protein CLUG_03346 [Clavispora lusitaniae ATCC 42720]